MEALRGQMSPALGVADARDRRCGATRGRCDHLAIALGWTRRRRAAADGPPVSASGPSGAGSSAATGGKMPVSRIEQYVAYAAAARFLPSYLRLADGTGTAAAVRTVTSTFRTQLITERVRATPVEARWTQADSLARSGRDGAATIDLVQRQPSRNPTRCFRALRVLVVRRLTAPAEDRSRSLTDAVSDTQVVNRARQKVMPVRARCGPPGSVGAWRTSGAPRGYRCASS
jgi:hypothetical protein